jgi:hypothetical protein
VVVRQQYVEKVVKAARGGDDTDIANANPLSLVLNWKVTVRFWDPQRKPALFDGEVAAVNVGAFLRLELRISALVLSLCRTIFL